MSLAISLIKTILEAAILSSAEPVSIERLAQLFSEEESLSNKELRAILQQMMQEQENRGYELKEVASGFRFQVKNDIAPWLLRWTQERPPRYSRALLETIALIAYRQPITRAEIEEVRGVNVSSHILRTLLEREWVKVVGHRELPGRPALYATTKQFLDYFNLKSLAELPTLAELETETENLSGVEQMVRELQAMAPNDTVTPHEPIIYPLMCIEQPQVQE